MKRMPFVSVTLSILFTAVKPRKSWMATVLLICFIQQAFATLDLDRLSIDHNVGNLLSDVYSFRFNIARASVRRQASHPKVDEFLQALSRRALDSFQEFLTSATERSEKIGHESSQILEQLIELTSEAGDRRIQPQLRKLILYFSGKGNIFEKPDDYLRISELLVNLSRDIGVKPKMTSVIEENRLKKKRAEILQRMDDSADAEKPAKETTSVEVPANTRKQAKSQQTSEANHDFKLTEIMFMNQLMAGMILENLTERAMEGNPERSLDINLPVAIEVLKTLLLHETPHALLLGDPGSGKTTIVENIPFLLKTDKIPAWLKKELTGFQFVAVTAKKLEKTLDEDPSYLKKIVQGLREGNSKAAIFIDEFHTLSEKTMEALKPFLTENQDHLRVIAASTANEYMDFSKFNPAFQRRFRTVEAPEISLEEIVKYLKSEALEKYGKRRNIKFQFDDSDMRLVALKARLAFKNQSPIQAVNSLLDSLGLYALEHGKSKIVRRDLADFIEARTKLPSDPLDQKKIKEFGERVKSRMNDRISNQGELISQLSHQVEEMLSSNESPKPRNIFLFGKSGLGKSMIGKELGNILFGGDRAVLEIDGASFPKGEAALAKLFGPAPSYVGFDQVSGVIPEFLDNDSRGGKGGVFLVNEFDKMAPEVQLAFLEMLDTGKVSGNDTKTRYFGNHIFVFTSNSLQDKMFPSSIQDFSKGEMKEWMAQFTPSELRQLLASSGLAPELLGRMHMVGFPEPMTRENAEAHARKRLDEVSKRLKKEKNLDLSIESKTLKQIVGAVFDFDRGYRTLDNALDAVIRSIENEVSRNGLREKKMVLARQAEGFSLNVSGKKAKDRQEIPVQLPVPNLKPQDTRLLQQIALHEVGHLLANIPSLTYQRASQVIITTNSQGVVNDGKAIFKDQDSPSLKTESELLHDVARAMGGRVAEELSKLPPSVGWRQDQAEISATLKSYVSGLNWGYVDFDTEGNPIYSQKQEMEIRGKTQELYEKAWKLAVDLIRNNWSNLQKYSQLLSQSLSLKPDEIAKAEASAETTAARLRGSGSKLALQPPATLETKPPLACRKIFK